jgi:high-affinity nickel permease
MNPLLLLVALVLGARHAFAPDHLAAVSTFTEKTEASRRQGLRYALRIAAGHSLGMVGMAGLIFGLLASLPPAWVRWTTVAAGIWLLAMAGWILWDLGRGLFAKTPSVSPGEATLLKDNRWLTLLKRPGAAWAVGFLFGIAVSPGDLAIFTIMIRNHAAPLTAFFYLAAFLTAMFAGLALVGSGLGWANTRLVLKRAFQGASGLAGLGVALALLTGYLH